MVNQSFRYTLFEEKLTKTLESKDKINELFTILYRYNPPTELGTNSSSRCKSVILLTHYAYITIINQNSSDDDSRVIPPSQGLIF